MKKNVILTSAVLAMTATSILLTACNKPAERPGVINQAIAKNLYAVNDLNEITSASDKVPKTVYYSDSEKPEVSKLDASLKQVKIEGKVQDLLNLVSLEASKKMLNDHLKTGVIALVVLNDQIKILKVVPETTGNFDLTLTSLAYLSKLKSYVKTSDAKLQASLASELENYRYKSPAELGEKFGLAEISAIIVKKHGHLDNERTDYNEKKSVLNIIENPFEVSTHILVGTEVGDEAAAKEASAKEAAAQKASAKSK